MMHRILVACFLASLIAGCSQLSALKLPPTYRAVTLENAEIAWLPGPAELALPSGGGLTVPAGADYVLDFTARAYDFQTTGDYADSTEAMIRMGAATLRIDYRAPGYVPETDYCHLDLERAKAGTLARIAQRNAAVKEAEKKQAMGLWTVPPHYEQAAHELTYGRLVGTNAKPGVNLFVARLVRRGFYLFTWSGSPQEATTALQPGHAARQIVESLRPAPDNTYEQYAAGDKLAGNTVAGFWDAPETAPAYRNMAQDCR